jgi:hypothetical protein
MRLNTKKNSVCKIFKNVKQQHDIFVFRLKVFITIILKQSLMMPKFEFFAILKLRAGENYFAYKLHHIVVSIVFYGNQTCDYSNLWPTI